MLRRKRHANKCKLPAGSIQPTPIDIFMKFPRSIRRSSGYDWTDEFEMKVGFKRNQRFWFCWGVTFELGYTGLCFVFYPSLLWGVAILVLRLLISVYFTKNWNLCHNYLGMFRVTCWHCSKPKTVDLSKTRFLSHRARLEVCFFSGEHHGMLTLCGSFSQHDINLSL